MKMAKKFLCVILAAFMVLSLTACNDESGTTTTTTPAATTTTAAAGGETPVDTEAPDDTGAPENTEAPDNGGDPAPSQSNWPDLREYFPFDYDQSKVIYATTFEDESEICTCEVAEECECDYSVWKRRWAADRSVTVDGVQTNVLDAYGPQVHELVPGGRVGSTSLLSGNRAFSWTGTIKSIYEYLSDTGEYEAFAWVKMPDDASPGRIIMSHQTNGDDGESYGWWEDYDGPEGIFSKYFLPIGTPDMARSPDHEVFYHYPEGYTADGWVLLHGTMSFVKMFYDDILFYFETQNGNALQQDLYIDCLVILKTG